MSADEGAGASAREPERGAARVVPAVESDAGAQGPEGGEGPLDRLWGALKRDPQGLVTAVVQHAEDGRVLMVGHMNRDALARTLAGRRVTFWSRSRGQLWEKGESSGNTLDLEGLWVDCDGDALLVRARPRGPTCHTGADTCFFRQVSEDMSLQEGEPPPTQALGGLLRVSAVIRERLAGRGATHAEGRSYVRSLAEAGAAKIGAKIREEAGELADAIAGEGDDRVASEAADLIFHALVGMLGRGVDLEDVAAVFDRRHGVSGIDEKARRR
ncbi:MAG: bifunctional phosphoribosyl-AMP cyclohydrolase/phosphoribosyl-ATP diphosphatase HisIE [Nannocystaceae bacterium]